MGELENQKEKAGEIEISTASPSDARQIREVFYKTWLNTYPNKETGVTVDDVEDMYKDAFTEESLNKSVERISNPPSGEHLFVAKVNDKIVGICRIIKHEEKNQLQSMYILPEFQGKGIGTLLWEEVKRLFDPAKDTFVNVAIYNKNAIDFYKKLGFKETGKQWEEEKFKLKSGATIKETELVIKTGSLFKQGL